MPIKGVTRGRAVLRLLGLVCWLGFSYGSVQAQPAGGAAESAANWIEQVSVSAVPEGSALTIRLKDVPTHPPTDFSTSNPARIVLDFQETGYAQRRHTLVAHTPELQAANLMQIGNRTRIVLELPEPISYRTEQRGRLYTIILGAQRAVTTAATALAKKRDATPGPLANDEERGAKDGRQPMPTLRWAFDRGADGAGRLVVPLDRGAPEIHAHQQGAQLIVELPGLGLPEEGRRRQDVAYAGSPVRMIRSLPMAGGTQLAIESAGAWEYRAYQTDTQFVVEVRPLWQEGGQAQNATPYHGEKLSLNFQNIEVRALLQVFADFTHLNVVVSDSVQGNLTLRLQDVPWDQALDIVLQTKGLSSRRNGNVLMVAPKDETAAKEKQELEAQAQVADLEPLRSQVFQLNYQRADDVRLLLAGDGQGGRRVLSKRGALTADPRTNQLFVSDIPAKLEEVQDLIRKVDVAVRQVMIEARIVEADDKFSQSLGVRLGGRYAGTSSSGNNTTVVTGGLTNTGPGGSNIGNLPFISLPAAALGGAAPANLAIGLFSNAAGRFINLELSALEADNRGKIISSPRVITADKIRALIEQGTEIPYKVSAQSGGTSTIQFRKAFLRLEVTPQITPEGSIILDVDVNKDSVGQQTIDGPAIDTKHIRTQVLVENAGTVVIGGIFQQVERSDVNKIPVLGDVPMLGNLFRNRLKQQDKTELLVFLTPRVLDERLVAR